jgi:hypothetical protein
MAQRNDNQTRQEINALWEKVEKEDMWFMLGARVNKDTAIAHTEGRWTVVKDGEAEEQCTEDELCTKNHPKTRGQSQMDQRRGEKRRTTHGKSNRRQMGTNQNSSYCGC